MGKSEREKESTIICMFYNLIFFIKSFRRIRPCVHVEVYAISISVVRYQQSEGSNSIFEFDFHRRVILESFHVCMCRGILSV